MCTMFEDLMIYYVFCAALHLAQLHFRSEGELLPYQATTDLLIINVIYFQTLDYFICFASLRRLIGIVLV
uniref:Putative ovule protein n=1 Tax=Solanum chacoense TaxID=4108 RepID=A0A0V0GRU3_SOLCH